ILSLCGGCGCNQHRRAGGQARTLQKYRRDGHESLLAEKRDYDPSGAVAGSHPVVSRQSVRTTGITTSGVSAAGGRCAAGGRRHRERIDTFFWLDGRTARTIERGTTERRGV